MVAEDEFQSQPCLTTEHTNGLRLGGLSWCECPDSVQRNSIWVRKVGMGRAKFVPAHDKKIGCSDHITDQIPISILFNHLLYYSWKIGSVELIWNGCIVLYTLNVDVNSKGPEAEILTTHESKVELPVVMVVEDEFQSQPCLTICYTVHERLDVSSWYEMAESVCTHSILMWIVRDQEPKF